jgi:hypothetical protein
MQDPLSADAFSTAYKFQQDPEAGDKSLNVRFFLDEMKDEAKSKKQGRPIFKSVEMCEIRYGDKDNIVTDRVKYMHPDPRRRFAAQYARFKAGEETQVEGTLLRQWGLITSAEAKGYEAVGIVTVEQLAGLADTQAQTLRGSIADRQKARDFLQMAAGQAPITQARAENERLRLELEALKDMVREMRGEAPLPEIKVRKKPGPKPKIQPES